MRKIAILCFLLAGWHLVLAGPPKNVMLILGSANPVILKNRMDVALRLYKLQPFDRIIVSGGCAAHGSSICEASFMSETLLKNGVPAGIVYKDENSKTTVQNYIFSRRLKEADGSSVMQAGDTVYVVSDHWHAVSVAARLKKYDKMEARFYIEGSIEPKASDKLDYASIFNGEPDNEKFILKGTWLTPEAVWQEADSTYYLAGSLVYVTDQQNSRFSYYPRSRFFPELEPFAAGHELRFIDAGKHWYAWNGQQLLQVDKRDRKVKQTLSLDQLVAGLPAHWKSSLKAGVVYGDALWLFSNDELLVCRKKGKSYVAAERSSAPAYFSGWPFGWGQGNVSAARLDAGGKKLYLYRNQEYLELDAAKKEASAPRSLRLKWIEN